LRKIRNAAIVIILCIIGSYSVMKKQGPVLNMPAGDEMKDAVKNNRARAPLNFRSGGDDQLRDAVANNPINTGSQVDFGNGDGGSNPPPRGSGNGGIGTLGTPSNGQNLPPNDPPEELSPSGPPSDECGQECFDESPR
jgi:hypothetical protein